MDLVVSDPSGFVSDVTAVAALTDSIASLVGAAPSRVSVTLMFGRRLTAPPGQEAAVQRGSSRGSDRSAREDADTRALSSAGSVQVSFSITTIGGPGTIGELNSDITSALTAPDAASAMQVSLTASLGASYTLTVESLGLPVVDNVKLTITSTTTSATTLSATETSASSTTWTTTTISTTYSTLTTSTSSTTTTTSSTSTTSTTSTTTSTSTTIGAVSLVAIPALLTSCNSLFVHAAVPDDTTNLTWSCEPGDSQLCANILSVAAAGAVVGMLEVSSNIVSDAAAADVDLGFPLAVVLQAHGLNKHGDQWLGSTTFTFDAFGGGLMSLVKAASTTEYTLLDDYVRLSTNAMFCNGAAIGGSIEVRWSWRRLLADTEALWTVWTNDAGVAYTSFKMPVSELGAAGDYEVKASIVGSEAGDAIFEVTVGDVPPPNAILSLPAKASKDCDFSLDASGSTDPGGSDLSVAWACESDNSSDFAASDTAVAACSAKVANETAFFITLPHGTLETGAYLFTAYVSRADARSTAQGAVLVTGSNQPVVSFSELAAEVSPQQPLTLSATITESASCVSPAWKAWWLMAPDGAGATQLAAGTEASLAELSVASLSAAPGAHYRMRLVLSESTQAGFREDSSNGVYVFDSAVFLIDQPPAGGSCEVFPSRGNATLTRFTLSSFNWLDDDLPLLHKFSRCSGAISDGCDSWTTVSAYSQSETMQNVLLSTPGTLMVQAEAKDTLGSSSAAVTEVEVVELMEDVSDAVLLDVVASVSRFGDPFSTLAALSAVADSSSGGNQYFSGILLDTMADSGALSDPDPETIDASTNALYSIVTSASAVQPTQSGDNATETTQEAVMEMEVATKAASLVTDIAVASKGLDEGMEVGTATLLISSVATLLNTATVTPSTTIESSTAAAGGSAPSDEEAAEQKGLSSQLQHAVEAIGDAVIQATPLGETVTMSTTTGLQLNIMRADNDALAAHGASLGGFTLPPMPGLAAGRRLRSGRMLTSGEAIGLQNAKWHKNPFSYAGSTAPAPASSTRVASDLSIATDGVRSFSIRLDGEEVSVRDLEDPIIIELPRHPDADSRRLFARRSLSEVQEEASVEQVEECMYFDHASEIWSTEGCSVVEVSGDMLVCACNHLSFFSSALGSLSVLGDFLCPNVAILAPEGFQQLGQGQWAQQRGGIVLWTLLAVHLVVTLMACWSQGSWTSKPKFFMYSDDARGYSKSAVLKKLVSAGQKSGKSKPKMLLVFFIHVVLKLKLDYDYDDLCEKSLFEVVRTLVFYKMMTMWVTATMGFSELDLRYMRHGKVLTTDASEDGTGNRKVSVRAAQETNDDGGGIEDDPRVSRATDPRESSNSAETRPFADADESRRQSLQQAFGRGSLARRDARALTKRLDNGLTDDFVATLRAKSRLLQLRRTDVATFSADQPQGTAASSEMSTAQGAAEAVQFSRELMVLYKAIHPLYKLLLYSMTVPWIFQIVALLDAVFGSLMLSAAFYGTSASPNVPECTGPDDLLGSLIRDMLVTLGSAVIGLAPIVVVLSRRNRTMPRVSEEHEVQKQLRKWFLKDVVIIVGGLLWFAFSVLYIMLFLANVSQQDADHWLISLMTRFISTWVLIPFVLATLLVILMRVFARFSEGNFIENSISALLRAVNHDDGGGGGGSAAVQALEERMSPISLNGARISVDPQPLQPEKTDGRVARPMCAGQDIHLPSEPPPAESEVPFWEWVGHLREQNQRVPVLATAEPGGHLFIVDRPKASCSQRHQLEHSCRTWCADPGTHVSLSLSSLRETSSSPAGPWHLAHSGTCPGSFAEPGGPERT